MKRLHLIRMMRVALLIIGLSSCATIFNGTRQKISLTSSPNGAQVYVNNQSTNKVTPCQVTVDRKVDASPYNMKNQYVFSYKYPGYEDTDVVSSARTSPTIWFNLLWGGILGIGIDYISGGAYEFDDNIHAQLKQAGNVKVIRDTVVKHQVVYVESKAGKPVYSFEKLSDVNRNIPRSGKEYPYRFALVVGNEDYSSYQVSLNTEINVDFARNDASAFKEYALNILGIPESNVIFLLDATTGQMNQAISKLNLIIKNTKGNADVFVYFAGHGLPDEMSKEPYIMPVDVSGRNATEGIKLSELYAKLLEFPSKRVTVFIDACFSGGARNQALVAARGVKVRPKEDLLQGKLVVFTASSGEQSSLPYKDKYHGFFTYFLLKKLKETAGDVSYKELSEYLSENIALQSVIVNSKEQTPFTRVSTSVLNEWGKWKLVE